jgi:7-keto-8-aminopelargonate synthetase-like enzyme
VQWGLEVKLTTAGLVFTVLGSVFGGVWYLSSRLTDIDGQLKAAVVKATAAEAAAAAANAEIIRTSNEATKERAEFLRRDEFFKYMAPEIRRKPRPKPSHPSNEDY